MAAPGRAPIRWLITGSRIFVDASRMDAFLKVLPKPDVLICGMAAGADTLAYQWAKAQGISVEEYPVRNEDYARWGRGAPIRRNEQMVNVGKPTLVLGFPANWKEVVGGTRHQLNYSLSEGVPTYYAGEKEWVQVLQSIA